MVPVVLWMLKERSVTYHLCNDIEFEYGRGSQGLWVQLFVLSKFPYVAGYHENWFLLLLCSTH